MRPGRFDRHISIDRPTMDGRKQIFRVYLQKIVTDENLTYMEGRLAALTPGFAGADIANCVNEAALVGMFLPIHVPHSLNANMFSSCP
jgi:AFG3 family protein